MTTDLSCGDWIYSGDVNPECGGTWFQLNEQDWRWGFCCAVRVSDLDSGCGFTGAVLIEHIVINGTDDRQRLREAMCCCGWEENMTCQVIGPQQNDPASIKRTLRLALVEALLAYGHYDPDDAWDNYRSHHHEIVQLEDDGPMAYDGWRADKRLRGGDLAGYIKARHLR